MIDRASLTGPIRIHHWPKGDSAGPTNWDGAKHYGTLEEAIKAHGGQPAPDGMSVWGLSGADRLVSPDELAVLFTQGE